MALPTGTQMGLDAESTARERQKALAKSPTVAQLRKIVEVANGSGFLLNSELIAADENDDILMKNFQEGDMNTIPLILKRLDAGTMELADVEAVLTRENISTSIGFYIDLRLSLSREKKPAAVAGLIQKILRSNVATNRDLLAAATLQEHQNFILDVIVAKGLPPRAPGEIAQYSSLQRLLLFLENSSLLEGETELEAITKEELVQKFQADPTNIQHLYAIKKKTEEGEIDLIELIEVIPPQEISQIIATLIRSIFERVSQAPDKGDQNALAFEITKNFVPSGFITSQDLINAVRGKEDLGFQKFLLTFFPGLEAKVKTVQPPFPGSPQAANAEATDDGQALGDDDIEIVNENITLPLLHIYKANGGRLTAGYPLIPGQTITIGPPPSNIEIKGLTETITLRFEVLEFTTPGISLAGPRAATVQTASQLGQLSGAQSPNIGQHRLGSAGLTIGNGCFRIVADGVPDIIFEIADREIPPAKIGPVVSHHIANLIQRRWVVLDREGANSANLEALDQDYQKVVQYAAEKKLTILNEAERAIISDLINERLTGLLLERQRLVAEKNPALGVQMQMVTELIEEVTSFARKNGFAIQDKAQIEANRKQLHHILTARAAARGDRNALRETNKAMAAYLCSAQQCTTFHYESGELLEPDTSPAYKGHVIIVTTPDGKEHIRPFVLETDTIMDLLAEVHHGDANTVELQPEGYKVSGTGGQFPKGAKVTLQVGQEVVVQDTHGQNYRVKIETHAYTERALETSIEDRVSELSEVIFDNTRLPDQQHQKAWEKLQYLVNSNRITALACLRIIGSRIRAAAGAISLWSAAEPNGDAHVLSLIHALLNYPDTAQLLSELKTLITPELMAAAVRDRTMSYNDFDRFAHPKLEYPIAPVEGWSRWPGARGPAAKKAFDEKNTQLDQEAAEAQRQYGSKAKNGAIQIACFLESGLSQTDGLRPEYLAQIKKIQEQRAQLHAIDHGQNDIAALDQLAAQSEGITLGDFLTSAEIGSYSQAHAAFARPTPTTTLKAFLTQKAILLARGAFNILTTDQQDRAAMAKLDYLFLRMQNITISYRDIVTPAFPNPEAVSQHLAAVNYLQEQIMVGREAVQGPLLDAVHARAIEALKKAGDAVQTITTATSIDVLIALADLMLDDSLAAHVGEIQVPARYDMQAGVATQPLKGNWQTVQQMWRTKLIELGKVAAERAKKGDDAGFLAKVLFRAAGEDYERGKDSKGQTRPKLFDLADVGITRSELAAGMQIQQAEFTRQKYLPLVDKACALPPEDFSFMKEAQAFYATAPLQEQEHLVKTTWRIMNAKIRTMKAEIQAIQAKKEHATAQELAREAFLVDRVYPVLQTRGFTTATRETISEDEVKKLLSATPATAA